MSKKLKTKPSEFGRNLLSVNKPMYDYFLDLDIQSWEYLLINHQIKKERSRIIKLLREQGELSIEDYKMYIPFYEEVIEPRTINRP